MKALVMTNGDYCDNFSWYRSLANQFNRIYCVDGAAAAAVRMNITPHVLLGDMDSISVADRKALEENQTTSCISYPSDKDYTDTQLALETARKEGSREICLVGGTGTRLDHSLANLFSAGRMAEEGLDVWFAFPELTIHFVVSGNELRLEGFPGDTVSILSMKDVSSGVTLTDFSYPLEGALLERNWPIGVSNVISGPCPAIKLEQGLLAVFHFLSRPS
jgi:thiamine pyrophosphokinase